MVSITIRSAGRPMPKARALPTKVDFPDKDLSSVTIGEVKAAIRKKFRGFGVERQKLSLESDKKALDDEKTLAAAGVRADGVLFLKDLGAQASWKVVYLIEYAGPLLIHPLFYYMPYFGGPFKPFKHSEVQKFLYVLTMLHFAKRELETLFLHRFSKSTMPFAYIFRNSAHYWLLSGLINAVVLYGPWYSDTRVSNRFGGHLITSPVWLWSWTAVWIFAEASNFITHLNLRSLRPAGTRARGIPVGYGFDLVSCPNYFFEIIAWLAIVAMTMNWAPAVFIAVGGFTMCLWAVKKHKAYKKEFGDKYPKGRKAIFPFVL